MLLIVTLLTKPLNRFKTISAIAFETEPVFLLSVCDVSFYKIKYGVSKCDMGTKLAAYNFICNLITQM